jgi:hypothetical protein
MTRRPRSHELLPARGSQMSLDFWLPRGTWNAKKHSELVRLFGEFIREYDGDQGLGDWEVRGREGWEARGRGPFKPLWKFVLKQIEGNRPKDGRIIDADEVFVLDLGPWWAINEAGTDLTGLYKLTFEMLRLWPEPSVYLGRVGKVRKDK